MDHVLTPREEKTINNILGRIYISLIIILYFNFFGYSLGAFANKEFILLLIHILLWASIFMFALIFILHFFKRTYRRLIVILFSSYIFLILATHIFIFSSADNYIQFIFEPGYISLTLFYIILTWLLITFTNYIFKEKYSSKFRVKVLSHNEVNETLENKYFFQAISKHIHVYIERYSDRVINEYYVYYIKEDKLIIFFNENSSTYRRNLFNFKNNYQN